MRLHAFITAQLATASWTIAAHPTLQLKVKYDVVLCPARYAALEEQWAAAHPDELLRELGGSRDLKLLRAAGLLVERKAA